MFAPSEDQSEQGWGVSLLTLTLVAGGVGIIKLIKTLVLCSATILQCLVRSQGLSVKLFLPFFKKFYLDTNIIILLQNVFFCFPHKASVLFQILT